MANYRKLKLMWLRKDGVREVTDSRDDKDNTPTSQRQAILRMLRKVILVNGAEVADCVLAEAPSVVFGGSDPLDKSLRDNLGKWMLPSKEWLAIRDGFLAEQRAQYAAQSDRMQASAAASVGEQLSELVTKSAASMRAKDAAAAARGPR